MIWGPYKKIQSSSVTPHYKVHISIENLWIHSSATTEIEYGVNLWSVFSTSIASIARLFTLLSIAITVNIMVFKGSCLSTWNLFRFLDQYVIVFKAWNKIFTCSVIKKTLGYIFGLFVCFPPGPPHPPQNITWVLDLRFFTLWKF